MERWTAIPPQRILDEHEVVYDSVNIEGQHAIEDLDNYPMFDDNYHEKRIFTADGKYIPRRNPRTRLDGSTDPPLGILPCVDSVRQFLFSFKEKISDDAEDEMFTELADAAGDAPENIQAFLPTEEYIPFAHVLEGFVILQKNPGWEKEDKMDI